MSLTSTINRVTAPWRRKVMLMVGRCVLEAVNDGTKCQTVKISGLADEVKEDVERFQDYGFSSVPYAGAEGVAVSVGGNRAHSIVVALTDRARRPTGLSEGDVAMYNANGVRCLLDQANDQVLLGNAPSAFVALADLVDARFAAVVADHNAHIHQVAAAPGPSAIPTVLMGSQATVAAAEVKAK